MVVFFVDIYVAHLDVNICIYISLSMICHLFMHLLYIISIFIVTN